MINKGNKLMTEVATGRDIALNWDVLVTPASQPSRATWLRARNS